MKAKLKYILVPFDYSDYSIKAGLLAFDLANKFNIEIIFLHAYQDEESNVSEAANNAKDFYDKEIKAGRLPDAAYSFILRKGVPEDEIKRFIRRDEPLVIIMGTRGKDRKINDLIGSVTAEVMDISEAPVFAVPESVELKSFNEIKNIGYATSLSDPDLKAFESMMEFMKPYNFTIMFVHILESGEVASLYKGKIDYLQNYISDKYPNINTAFKLIPAEKSLAVELNDYYVANKIDVLAVKSNHRNIFSRIFVASLAKKLVFQAKTPLIVLH
ncbi:MAG: universal stress protein, partial [Paludibacteraceae bacterium]|nr:universal stress protein [Paludibacteraceae bacterium]